MTSKKPAAAKRSTLPRASDHTKAFVKDWTRLSHSGRYDLNQLKEAMLLLIANDGPLPACYLRHVILSGTIRANMSRATVPEDHEGV